LMFGPRSYVIIKPLQELVGGAHENPSVR
jgi:hypothetical protein